MGGSVGEGGEKGAVWVKGERWGAVWVKGRDGGQCG